MLAWHQYSELIALRAGASTSDQSADLQKKIADLQKSNRELEEQLAALRASHEDGLEDMAAAEERPARPAAQNGGQRNGRNGRGEQQAAAMRELLARPDVQADWAKQGAAPMSMRPAQFERYLADDIVKWERIVKISGARADR